MTKKFFTAEKNWEGAAAVVGVGGRAGAVALAFTTLPDRCEPPSTPAAVLITQPKLRITRARNERRRSSSRTSPPLPSPRRG